MRRVVGEEHADADAGMWECHGRIGAVPDQGNPERKNLSTGVGRNTR
jgi:hypothetical protein